MSHYADNLTPVEAHAVAASIMEESEIKASVSESVWTPATKGDGWNQEHYAYRVTFSAPGVRVWFPWRTGMGHKPNTVDPANVLTVVCSDALDADEARSFEEWADDLGMDTDSRKAERMYRLSLDMLRRVKRLLADEDVERLAELSRMF